MSRETGGVDAPDDPATPRILRDYMLLADGERGVILDPHGTCAWLCMPYWDSPAILSGLIGGRGTYAIRPEGRWVWGGYYEPGTLIWRTRWVTDDGAVLECRQALAFPAEQHRVILLSQLEVLHGAARVTALLAPAAEFGAAPFDDCAMGDDGLWTGSTGAFRVRWSGARDARPVHADVGQALGLTLDLHAGETHDLVLEVSDVELSEPVRPDLAWTATRHAWAAAVPPLAGSVAPTDARHACAVLRGLTSASGAMVAAATTSLPERAEQGRNYDYRYAWIRDQAFAGHAAAAVPAGPTNAVLDDAVRFVAARLLADGPALRPAYTVRGQRIPEERHLDLPGYPGGTDVIGNRVRDQFQLDAFGEAVLLLATAAQHDRLDADAWRALEVAVDAIASRWTEPDAGIWELGPRHWTHSRLIAVAGLRRAASVAGSAGLAANWLALADAITAATSSTSVHESGRWQRAPDDDRCDAALLLPTLRGALPPDDPRHLATLEAVRHDLSRDCFVYRFQHHGLPLNDPEGAFLLCGFLMALAEQQQGDAVTAIRYFERNRTACGPGGLFCEEFEIQQRQLRGNLPQAFVHALLLEASAALASSGV